MQIIEVPYIKPSEKDINTISILLDQQKNDYQIQLLNWIEFPYKPSVSFKLAHSSDHVFIKFKVFENSIRAMNKTPNSAVWEDSCCEFFCAFDDKGYYNIEINCIGTILMQWGKDRNNRVFAPEKLIHSIQVLSSLDNSSFDTKEGNFNWEITLSIPITSFFKHSFNDFSKLNMIGNFYKCGNKLIQKHYLSLFPIKSVHPDFHRPEFFGKINFL